MNALLARLEQVAEQRYGRGSTVDVIPPDAPPRSLFPLATVEIRNPEGALVTSALHISRTHAIIVLLKSFGEEVTF